MTDSFADQPVSIAELRANKEANAALWAPRDALISALRQLDAGEISPTMLIVCWANEKQCDYENAAPSVLHSFGMMARVAYRLNMNADPD